MKIDFDKVNSLAEAYEYFHNEFTFRMTQRYSEAAFKDEGFLSLTYDEYIEEKVKDGTEFFIDWIIDQYFNRK